MAQFPDEQSDDGSFDRQEDAFRDWVSDEAGAQFPPEAGRYHLYVSLACPWAHRIILLRKMLGLEDAIGMTVVDPIRDEDGWAFREGRGHSTDPVNGFDFLKEAYEATKPDYEGRVTVPVLWDKKSGRIVSNSDDDLLVMFNDAFRPLASSDHNFRPEEILDEMEEWNQRIYETVNDGVYRAGFASSQAAYENAVLALFETLDAVEEQFSDGRDFFFGDQVRETDVRLFVTLIRFDPVYHGHFKCNLRRIADYHGLSRFVEKFREIDGVEDTINFDHIKRHYYVTHDDINPSGIVPVGPAEAMTRYGKE